MKVRILGNTIRLRVKMFEADAMRDLGRMEEVLAFGPDASDQFRFEVLTGGDAYAIQQNGTHLSIIVPKHIIDEWVNTDKVGFEESITTPKGAVVKVLIEKDWACLDNDREDEAGSYPNPLEGSAC